MSQPQPWGYRGVKAQDLQLTASLPHPCYAPGVYFFIGGAGEDREERGHWDCPRKGGPSSPKRVETQGQCTENYPRWTRVSCPTVGQKERKIPPSCQ